MNLKDAISIRRSIRRYLNVAIEEEKVAKLQEIIDELNKSLDLHIQLVLNDKAVSEKGQSGVYADNSWKDLTDSDIKDVLKIDFEPNNCCIKAICQ